MSYNNEKLENISNSIYNFVCEYRKYNNWYFYDEEIKDLDSVKKILDNEDQRVDFMDDLSRMFYFFTSENNFENKQEEKFFDTLCSIFKEYNSFINSYNKEYDVNSLAKELIEYAKDSDPYEYNDIYNSDEDAFNDVKKNLYDKDSVYDLIGVLCEDIRYFSTENDLSNDDILNNFKSATDLLIKLNKYTKILENQNDKEMDI